MLVGMSLPESFASRLRQVQIVVAALAGGAASFLVVASVLRLPGEVERTEPLLGYVAIGITAGALGARFVLPGLLRTRGRKQIRAGEAIRGSTDEERLLALYQSEVILGAALLEGAALFGAVAALLERSPIGIGLGIMMITLMLFWEFPTRVRLEDWLEEQGKRLRAGD